MKINKFLINKKLSIEKALLYIKKNGYGIIFIGDDKKKVIGSLSDGDIRNHIIGGKNIKDNVSSCMNKNFKFVEESKLNNEILIKLFEQNIKVLPILLKSGKIKKFINPSVIEKKTETIDKVEKR
jgi:signal-transduction protein with cAMP-binding, CBS, and nucleotidyltransferase domain